MRGTFGRDVLAAFGRILTGMLPAALVCAVPAALIPLDVVVFRTGCCEFGVVEVTQSLALLAIVAMTLAAAVRRPAYRGGLVLAAGLFLDMFLREQDQLLELWLPHGAWVWPVAVTTAAAFAYARARPASVRDFLVAVRESLGFPVLAFGFLTVVCLSRVFGMRPLWQAVVAADHLRIVKRVAEEGLELFGYCTLVSWAALFLPRLPERPERDKPRSTPTKP